MAARRSFVRLRCGRRLAYCVFGDGDAAAATAIYHHGWPSSLQEAAVLNAAAAVAAVRVVAFDRPGVGGTSPVADFSFRAVADDVAQLMDALGVESAMQVGVSGGL
jgi:pimeloyl-ACP methyl ester carboxylesterase